VGDELILYGKPKISGKKLQFICPEYELIEQGEDSLNLGRIMGIYHSTPALSQKFLRKIIFLALGMIKKDLVDPLPFDIRREKNFPNIVKSIEEIHFPSSFEAAESARERFIFEELFFSQVLVYLRKAKQRLQAGMPFKANEEVLAKIRKNLNFQLTASQEQALSQIISDLQKPYPMHRLLQGDVGCGKTVVSAFALALCAASGFQAAFMVPTEVLAYQHKETFKNLFKGLNFTIELLVSSLNSKKIKKVHDDLKEGKIDIIVGTHALIQEEVQFKALGLAVIDEQHKFGVAQRAMLPKKGKLNPHYLVMSATPIPRTLALSLYGDLDLSVIRELPQGRIQPHTVLVKEEKRKEIYDFLRKKLKEGRQAYIIYPVIEESEDKDLQSLEIMYAAIAKEFPDFCVGMFHGRLRPEKKLAIIRDFKEKKIDILVSTTVVEVGVDIENSTVMMVENPERFGLAQLHQLRGRIQRSGFEPDFILIAKDEYPEAVSQRLMVIATVNDGFAIAEEDLKLRGPGDFFGHLQHGLPYLRIANPLRDLEILKDARLCAYHVIRKDPHLESPTHRSIRQHLDFWFKGNTDKDYSKVK
jgi:ATP-dependent DNA helicase RecG